MEGGGEVYALGDGQLLRTDLDRQAEPCQGEVPLRHREEVGAPRLMTLKHLIQEVARRLQD